MRESLASLVHGRAAEIGEYGGVTTAVRFTDPETEWRALAEGVAVLDLTRRRTIVARGEERAQFLQGQLSQDVLSMVPGEGRAALLLNAQGRVQSMLTVYAYEDRFELRVDADLLEATQARLDQFLIADDVEFETRPRGDCLAVAGPNAMDLLARLGVADDLGTTGSPSVSTRIGACEVRVYARQDLRVPFVEIEPSGDAGELWNVLCAAGAVPVGVAVFEVVRIESGTPRYGVDVDDARIAMEARLEWAIHFSKGCYVGQEVIERAVSRGRLNRELCLLATVGEVRAGDRLQDGSDKELVTSVARSPLSGWVCLAYLPLESAKPGTAVRIVRSDGFVDARVLEWPRPRRLRGR